MRVLLFALGSTGDAKPQVELGRELLRRGHTVTLCAFEALESLTKDTGIGFHALPGDAKSYIGKIIQPGASPLTFLTRIEETLGGIIEPLLDALLAACQNNDCMVTSFFGATPYAIAEHLGIPLFQSNYCFTDTTGDACLPIMRQPPFGRWFNRLTYRVAYRMIGMLEKRCIRPWLRKHQIPERFSSHGINHQIGDWTVPVLYAFSEHVVKRPPEWPDNISIVGFWEEDISGYTPDPELVRFLQDGDLPVYIGFGSMASGDMGDALQIVLQALEMTGLRAVISSGWGGMDSAQLPASVHVIRSYVPHQWLFSQVKAVVHHGGAGTTASGLHAGRPTLVIPFGSDQFFWSDHVYALDCGPAPIPRKRLSAKRLAARLEELISTPRFAQSAKRVQAQLLSEHGVCRAADIMEQSLASVHFAPKEMFCDLESI